MGSWLWCLLWFLHVSDVRIVFASYCLRYLCLYVHSSVFVLFFFVLCTPCCQFGFSFFITSSTLSTVFYLQYITQKKKQIEATWTTLKPEVNSTASDGWIVSVLAVTPVVFHLDDMNIIVSKKKRIVYCVKPLLWYIFPTPLHIYLKGMFHYRSLILIDVSINDLLKCI